MITSANKAAGDRGNDQPAQVFNQQSYSTTGLWSDATRPSEEPPPPPDELLTPPDEPAPPEDEPLEPAPPPPEAPPPPLDGPSSNKASLPGQIPGVTYINPPDPVSSELDAVLEAELDRNIPVEEWPFPIDVLPTPLPEYIRLSAEDIGCGESMIAVPMIVAASGVIGNSRWVEVNERWRKPCMLWAMVIADSGAGKTPAIEAGAGPTQAIDEEYTLQFERDLRTYESQLKQYKAGLKTKTKVGIVLAEPVRPSRRRLVFQDVTIEALATVLSRNPRGGVLISDEIAVWMNSFNQYRPRGKGNDIAKWNQVWNGNKLDVDRNTGDYRELSVMRPFVSVTGGTQIGRFASMVTDEKLDSGMLARVLMTLDTKAKRRSRHMPADSNLYKAVAEIFKQLSRLEMTMEQDRPRPQYVPLSSAARKRFYGWQDDWEDQIRKELRQEVTAAMTKIVSYVPRLALVLHLLKTASRQTTELPPVPAPNIVNAQTTPVEEIDLVTLNGAIRLGEWFANEARRIYAAFAAQKSDRSIFLDTLLAFLRSQSDWISRREIQRHFRTVDASRLSAELAGLESRGLVQNRLDPNPASTGRRPGPEYRIVESTDAENTAEGTGSA